MAGKKEIADMIDKIMQQNHNLFDTLYNGISQNNDKINETYDSISSLLSGTLSYKYQCGSVVVGILSLALTILTFINVICINNKMKKINAFADIRKNLNLLKASINTKLGNRPIASNKLEHLKNLATQITLYEKNWEKRRPLKDTIDKINSSTSLGLLDVQSNIEILLNEIGEKYAA